MDLSRIRKAIVAGLVATGGAVVSAVVEGGAPGDADAWVALVAGAVGVGVVAGLAVYKVRNAGTVNGSDPVLNEPARFTTGWSGTVDPPTRDRDV